jgi:hypothetical protein
MGLHFDSAHRLNQLLRNVSTVTDLDPEIDRLREQFDSFERTAGHPAAVDSLAAAVAAGENEALPVLFAASLAEVAGTAQAAAEVVSQVRQRVQRKIRDRMAENGTATYTVIAGLFDAATAAFMAATAAVDVEASADAVVDLSDKARKLWRSAPNLADDLDRVAIALHSAAVLAGIAADDPAGKILVCVDADGTETDAIRAAWDIKETQLRNARSAANNSVFTDHPTVIMSRCGRWSALLRAGAVIRPCPADELIEHRRPKPIPEEVTVFQLEDPPAVTAPRGGRITVL